MGTLLVPRFGIPFVSGLFRFAQLLWASRWGGLPTALDQEAVRTKKDTRRDRQKDTEIGRERQWQKQSEKDKKRQRGRKGDWKREVTAPNGSSSAGVTRLEPDGSQLLHLSPSSGMRDCLSQFR